MTQWSNTTILIAASATGLIVSIGLCSVGTPFEGGGTHLQDVAAGAGTLIFLASFLGLCLGVIGAIWKAIVSAFERNSGDRI